MHGLDTHFEVTGFAVLFLWVKCPVPHMLCTVLHTLSETPTSYDSDPNGILALYSDQQLPLSIKLSRASLSVPVNYATEGSLVWARVGGL